MLDGKPQGERSAKQPERQAPPADDGGGFDDDIPF
jgi:hypothetical protein